jgi:hypothetical protein
MIRIYLPYIFGLAHDLEPLAALPDNQAKKLGEVFLTLLNADNAITQLMSSTSLFAPICEAQTHSTPRDFERELSQYDLWGIRNIYAQYRTALLAELGSFNAYFVSAKGGFDMYSLLQAGEAIFPSELATKVPEALTDAREAAKALAYDVPTSCGFHTSE